MCTEGVPCAASLARAALQLLGLRPESCQTLTAVEHCPLSLCSAVAALRGKSLSTLLSFFDVNPAQWELLCLRRLFLEEAAKPQVRLEILEARLLAHQRSIDLERLVVTGACICTLLHAAHVHFPACPSHTAGGGRAAEPAEAVHGLL